MMLSRAAWIAGVCLALAGMARAAEPTEASAPAAIDEDPGVYGTAKGLVGLPRFEAFVLKSGAWVYVQVPTAPGPATVSWLRDAPGWDAVVRTCPLADADSWIGLAGFFGTIAAEKVPVSHELAGPDRHTACVLTAAWGVTDDTRNVVLLNVTPASGPSFQSTVSRSEAQALAARLASLAQEVRKLRAPASEPQGPDEITVVSARTLYALKGWGRVGDPGWEADLSAMQRATEVGWLPSDIVVRAMQDRRMRPGALGDVLGL